jgi:hypothetical protein
MKLALVAFGIVIGLALALLLRVPAAGAKDRIACEKWQTTSGPFPNQLIADKPPEVGSPTILTTPPGWEPFAVGQTGILYRRCVP